LFVGYLTCWSIWTDIVCVQHAVPVIVAGRIDVGAAILIFIEVACRHVVAGIRAVGNPVIIRVDFASILIDNDVRGRVWAIVALVGHSIVICVHRTACIVYIRPSTRTGTLVAVVGDSVAVVVRADGDLIFAIGVAPVAVFRVVVVAFFAIVHGSIPAGRTVLVLTIRAAAVSAGGVSVVAFLAAFHRSVTADRLAVLRRAAAHGQANGGDEKYDQATDHTA
jgi:hypothetical protein